jgi:hypothetical protein
MAHQTSKNIPGQIKRHDRMLAVLPALGTHTAMQPEQIARMFGAMPQERFRVHNWRTDVETLGEVPAEFTANNRKAS